MNHQPDSAVSSDPKTKPALNRRGLLGKLAAAIAGVVSIPLAKAAKATVQTVLVETTTLPSTNG
jgi:hypothetical protein